MSSEYLFEGFCRNRNIKDSTVRSYRSAIRKYELFHDRDMGSLMDEAIVEEDEGIMLKNRKIKKRLLDFRSFLLDSDLAISRGHIFLGSRRYTGTLRLNCPI